IASSLFLNEDLTEAIALGHDLGHTPFGHAGERALNTKYPFSHSRQSLRVVEKLEDEGKGLNLTWEVRDGIVNHSMSRLANTLEGRIVRLSDKIAYINHDMDDAIRAGILSEDDVPKEIANVLGATRKARLDFLVKNIIENSIDRDDIVMSQEAFEAMIDLRQFMFDNLYFNSSCKTEEYKAEGMVITLYDYYLDHQEKLPDDIKALIRDKNTKPERAVCDYISGMTDYYCTAVFTELFIPEFWGK
ncbi:MAG: HD domain-containing protein, partial [Parasporobacterium sp.]|nr:HD domain-containing protein [Parasporobacterium sp.]